MPTCPIADCGLEIDQKHLMCRSHWWTTPQQYRSMVLRALHRYDFQKDEHRLEILRDAQQIAIEECEKVLAKKKAKAAT